MRRTDLAVVDALAVPRRSNWNFGTPPALRLHGFYIEDRTIAVTAMKADSSRKLTWIMPRRKPRALEPAGRDH